MKVLQWVIQLIRLIQEGGKGVIFEAFFITLSNKTYKEMGTRREKGGLDPLVRQGVCICL